MTWLKLLEMEIVILLELEFLLFRFPILLLLLPLPLACVLQTKPSPNFHSFGFHIFANNLFSCSIKTMPKGTYLSHHVAEVFLLIPQLLLLSCFFVPVSQLQKKIIHKHFPLHQHTLCQSRSYILLGRQHIIHNLQFLRLYGDIHLIRLLVFEKINLQNTTMARPQ